MKPNSAEKAPATRRGRQEKGLGMIGTYLMAFAVCGWLILMANMFGIARSSGWIFPTVRDIPGLAGSTILLAFLALTPVALRQILRNKEDPK